MMTAFFKYVEMVLILFSFPFFQIAVAQTPNFSLDDFRREVLAKRVDFFITSQEEALLQCMDGGRHAREVYLSIQELRLFYVHSQKATLNHVLKLLDAYRLLEQFSNEQISLQTTCGLGLKAARSARFELERKRFAPVQFVAHLPAAMLPPFTGTSVSPLDFLLMQLDPVCVSNPMPDFETPMSDRNACYAGVSLLLSSVRDFSPGVPRFELAAAQVDALLSKLNPMFELAKTGDYIDLAEGLDLPQNSIENRRRALALLAVLYASPGSRVGFASPFGDAFWTGPLLLGQDPVFSYNQYMLWRNRKDQFYDLINAARKRGIRIGLGSQEFTHWNHHTVISAFLACHYRSNGPQFLAKLVPDAMGYVYESLDFASHLREGLGWSKSARNFSEDTERHRVGARFGDEYCR